MSYAAGLEGGAGWLAGKLFDRGRHIGGAAHGGEGERAVAFAGEVERGQGVGAVVHEYGTGPDVVGIVAARRVRVVLVEGVVAAVEKAQAVRIVDSAAWRHDVERRVPALVGAGDRFSHGAAVRGFVLGAKPAAR